MAQESRHRIWLYDAELDRVVDGDTVDFWVDLGFETWVKTRFRLDGINTPEVRGKERKEGVIASLFLKSLLEHNPNNIVLETRSGKKGKYGRWICTIWLSEFFAPATLIDGALVNGVPKKINYIKSGDGKYKGLGVNVNETLAANGYAVYVSY